MLKDVPSDYAGFYSLFLILFIKNIGVNISKIDSRRKKFAGFFLFLIGIADNVWYKRCICDFSIKRTQHFQFPRKPVSTRMYVIPLNWKIKSNKSEKWGYITVFKLFWAWMISHQSIITKKFCDQLFSLFADTFRMLEEM